MKQVDDTDTIDTSGLCSRHMRIEQHTAMIPGIAE
jgi:hypothetical protein